MVHIYHLYDKKLQAPVYVGATINTKLRFSNHLITTLKGYVNKNAVCLEVLETVERAKAGDVELFWLNEYTRRGIKLLNATRKKYPIGYGEQKGLKTLSQDAINAILKDADLYATVAKILNIAPSGLSQALKRNGNKVNRMENVEAIADAMGLTPDDIREDVNELAKAV